MRQCEKRVPSGPGARASALRPPRAPLKEHVSGSPQGAPTRKAYSIGGHFPARKYSESQHPPRPTPASQICLVTPCSGPPGSGQWQRPAQQHPVHTAARGTQAPGPGGQWDRPGLSSPPQWLTWLIQIPAHRSPVEEGAPGSSQSRGPTAPSSPCSQQPRGRPRLVHTERVNESVPSVCVGRGAWPGQDERVRCVFLLVSGARGPPTGPPAVRGLGVGAPVR